MGSLLWVDVMRMEMDDMMKMVMRMMKNGDG